MFPNVPRAALLPPCCLPRTPCPPFAAPPVTPAFVPGKELSTFGTLIEDINAL